MAVACQAGGLRGDNFYSAFLAGEIAYHDFEGVTVHETARRLGIARTTVVQIFPTNDRPLLDNRGYVLV